MDTEPTKLAPPAVASLRSQTAGVMERTLSQDIREEGKELKEAAEKTLNVIVDINLNGTVRWVSPSWVDVIGTLPDAVQGKPISDVVVSEPTTIFTDVVDSMKGDDSRSQFIRFSVRLGPKSKLLAVNDASLEVQNEASPETSAQITTSPDSAAEAKEEADPYASCPVVDLEGQGIMVHDTGGESHAMWMLRPWVAPREVKIGLDSELVDSLGSGAEVLASYLTHLAETGTDDNIEQAAPAALLCRICERQIPCWWFEKHTDLCLQEHQAEMEVQMSQEALAEHRHAIVKVLDALEARKSRSLTGEQAILPAAEYKGMAIGPPPSSSSSPGAGSPTAANARSRDRSGGFGHARARSFAVRRPQARIVELLLDLCDTAMEISTPAIKDVSAQTPGEFRTQSPQSESRISQVLQWQSPSTNTLEQEHGLALLCADTERIAKTKVDAVFRHRKVIEYAERIRVEFAIKVQECIDDAMQRAARIAAGRLSDSTGSDVGAEEDIGDDSEVTPALEDLPDEEGIFPGSFDTGRSLALALERASLGEDPDKRQLASALGSTRSSSPKECPTPRSYHGIASILGHGTRESRQESMMLESDAAESEGSIRSSSVTSRPPPRNESPISEFGDLRRQASSRSHNRRSWILPGTVSPARQESPSRSSGPHQPASPLRINKPRNTGGYSEPMASPEASPRLANSEFSSPIAVPLHLSNSNSNSQQQQQHHLHHYSQQSHHHHHHHHRRQSSAAVSSSTGDNVKLPPSPRLNGVIAQPLARAVPPSIKDFEVIKPISKGAFGSVYLSKKKTTGEYFAIKVLKKADMVAKNQVTNVKAERAIMMWQGESDFVAKLYWTFSSKEYLYLVMEYLNGGDCASLIKVLGGLPEDWVQKYLGEVVLGVEHLHSRGIVHRDLKPDNLLIDQKGHLKLTDFGLSRMGLVGRQKRALHAGASEPAPDLLKTGPFARSLSVGSSASRSTSLDVQVPNYHSPTLTPQMTPSDIGLSLGQPSYFSLGPAAQNEPRRISTNSQRSDSGGSDTLAHMLGSFSLNDTLHGSAAQAIASPNEGSEGGSPSPDLGSLRHSTIHAPSDQGKGTPPPTGIPPPNWALFDPEDKNRRFVGTPDYLAPETIRGEPQDETSDWWSVGCILYEFLYGIPPFHASEPEQVFANILARKLHWPAEDEDEVSPEAKDLINKLLCIDPRERLGSNKGEKFASGGEEVRSHPWFDGLNWESLLEDEAQFVPQPENPEDTEYFDARGATLQAFAEEMEDQLSPPTTTSTTDYPDRPHDALSRVRSQVNSMKRGLMPLHIPPHVRDLKSRRLSEPMVNDDFGNFAYKNLPVLDKANKDMIQKLRAEALAAQNKSAAVSPGGMNQVTSPGGMGLEGSPVLANPIQRTLSNAKASQRPQSPSGVSNAHSSPSRISQPSSPLLVSFIAGQEGRRKASSTSSNLSQHSGSGSSLQPGNFFDVPRVPPSLQKAATSVGVSPVKSRGSAPPPLTLSSPQRSIASPRHGSGSSSTARSRSLTVGSQDGSPVTGDLASHHRNRRSQVFDMSPSSSDNEGEKANAAFLRVQRHRESSRRLSQITYDQPTFRALDVLICEDHPVSRMVMEKLLEKMRCRTISASTGPEAVRYAMSDIKFDIIFMEFKLPQIIGADVAKMIRETKHANSHTPLVAITAYLKELQAPHYFDSLIEKPITPSKLTEVLTHFCQWRPASPHDRHGSYHHLQKSPAATMVPPPAAAAATAVATHAHPTPSNLRQESLKLEDSPTSGTSSSAGFATRTGSSFRGSSREDSISSSLFGDSESVSADELGVLLSRKATNDWEDGGLGIGIPSEKHLLTNPDANKVMTTPGNGRVTSLTHQISAPAKLEQHDSDSRAAIGPIATPKPRRSFEKLRAKRELMEKRRLEGNTGIDSADDEDDELGLGIGSNPSGVAGQQMTSAPVPQPSSSPSSSVGSSASVSAPSSISSASASASVNKQHYRRQSVLPSSKLGIEMMRANSHDSVKIPTSASSQAGVAAPAASTTGFDATYSGNRLSSSSRTSTPRSSRDQSPLSGPPTLAPPGGGVLSSITGNGRLTLSSSPTILNDDDVDGVRSVLVHTPPRMASSDGGHHRDQRRGINGRDNNDENHDDDDDKRYGDDDDTIDVDKTPRRPAPVASSALRTTTTTAGREETEEGRGRRTSVSTEEKMLKTPTEETKWSYMDDRNGDDGDGCSGQDTTPRPGEKIADIIIETTMATPTSENGGH
ncbi:hypothetical protein BD289DRAFT_488560 [Coniella lustricola]|uniref:non-specific serine/threonine protein kinase n=1 Tax=Coniella lustricola TaxID=2025994 RepID=A0A2T3A3F3_9PEZI|nr:hypothetical protein BD289DRAFT_488560 [Coniella lustricola]